jgi:hypothetical protein
MRTRFGSITEKCPAQSWREKSTRLKKAPASVAGGIGKRNRTIPHCAGSLACQASSPKSLSKVSRTRSSRTARASTSASGAPGESVRTHARSCPAARSATTASPGKFSLARNRTPPRSVRRYRIDFFRAQRIAGVAQARGNILMSDAWVVAQDVCLIPAVRKQAHDEIHR